MSNVEQLEESISEQVQQANPTSIASVLQLAKNSEDADVAYIMCYQLNVMYESNVRFRGKAALLTEDVQMTMRMMDHMLRQRQPRPRRA